MQKKNKATVNYKNLDYKKLLPLAKRGDAAAQFWLGKHLYFGSGVEQDIEKAAEYFMVAAAKIYCTEENPLADFYFEIPKRIPKNYMDIDKLYDYIILNNDAKAELLVGYAHAAEKRYVTAARWFKKSAEQGNDIAQSNLGLCYYNGYGVKEDFREAVKWFRKSAKQGNKNAKKILEIIKPKINRG